MNGTGHLSLLEIKGPEQLRIHPLVILVGKLIDHNTWLSEYILNTLLRQIPFSDSSTPAKLSPESMVSLVIRNTEREGAYKAWGNTGISTGSRISILTKRRKSSLMSKRTTRSRVLASRTSRASSRMKAEDQCFPSLRNIEPTISILLSKSLATKRRGGRARKESAFKKDVSFIMMINPDMKDFHSKIKNKS